MLPRGFKRIRHYGLLSPARKTVGLAAARSALAVPAPDPVVVEAAADFLRRVAGITWQACPHCRQGAFRVVASLPAQSARHARAPP